MRSNTGQILYIPRVGQRANLQHPLMKGCVGWWPLTDGGGGIARDITANANDGTVVGGAGATWANTEKGTAFDSDGTDDTGIDITTSVIYSQATSYSLWFYNDALGSPNNFFFDSDDTTDRQAAWIDTANVIRMYAGTTTPTVFSPSFNEWHHVVFVFNGSSSVCYLDGVASSALSPGTWSQGDFSIGYSNPNSGRFAWEGNLQNFRFYNRAVSATEVFELYTNPWSGLSIPSTTRYFFVSQPQQIFPPRMKLKTSINVSKGGRIVI